MPCMHHLFYTHIYTFPHGPVLLDFVSRVLRNFYSRVKTMRQEGVQPSPRTYTTAINACSRTSDWKRALLLLVEMRQSYPSLPVVTPPAEQQTPRVHPSQPPSSPTQQWNFLAPTRQEEDPASTGTAPAAAAAVVVEHPTAKEDVCGGGGGGEGRARGGDARRRHSSGGKGYTESVHQGDIGGNGSPDWWGRGSVSDVNGGGTVAARKEGFPGATARDGGGKPAGGTGGGGVVREEKIIVGGRGRGDGKWGRASGVAGRAAIEDGRRAAHNAAINVCGRAGRWDRALGLLEV